MTQVPEAYEQVKKHIIIASQQKLVTLNSRMNSANKAICYVEVINMHSLLELLNSTPVHNTPQWYIQCTLTKCVFVTVSGKTGLIAHSQVSRNGDFKYSRCCTVACQWW